MALDLPQRYGLEHAEARAGHPAERVPASVLHQSPHTHAGLQCNLVSGHADAGNIFHSGRDRNPSHALLPPLRAAGLRGHERPAVRRVVWIVSAQSASLVSARHGFPGLRAHVQGFLPRRLPHSARIQLGDRRGSSADHAVAQLHGLSASLGPTGLLGNYRGIEYRFCRAAHGQQDPLPMLGGMRSTPTRCCVSTCCTA